MLKSSEEDSYVVRELKATILHDLKHRYEKSCNVYCSAPLRIHDSFLDEVDKSNVHHAIITDLWKLADEPVKLKWGLDLMIQHLDFLL